MKKKIKHDEKTFRLCVAVARDIHKGQIRKIGADKGKPYIIHPERVAISLIFASRYGDYGDACVGVLHDCIEDYDYTKLPDSQTKDSIYLAKGYLEMRGVSKDIIKDVELLSKEDGDDYFIFVKRLMKSERAIRVKIKDIEDNLKGLEEGKLKEKYKLALALLLTHQELIKTKQKLKKEKMKGKPK